MPYNKSQVDARFPKPDACAGCPLATLGWGYARTDGTGSSGVALIGEALGETEAVTGLPFKGAAGSTLNRVLHLLPGVERNDFLIMNVVCCRPPNNELDGSPWQAQAIDHCDTYFRETLRNHPEIRVLVPMGNIPLYKLVGHRGIKANHGYVSRCSINVAPEGAVPENRRYWVVPTPHPSAVNREESKELYTLLVDILKAVRVAKDRGYPRLVPSYITTPSIQQAADFVADYESALRADPDLLLAADIETPFSGNYTEEELEDRDLSTTIVRTSFSFREGHAISIPWRTGFRPLIDRLLASPGPKAWWNGHAFDIPRLAHLGTFCSGEQYDFMNAWHFLYSDLSKGLGYVAPFFCDLPEWKSKATSRPEFYSAVDADATFRIATAIRELLRKRNNKHGESHWDVWLRYFHTLVPVTQGMSATGVGIDDAIRDTLVAHYTTLRDNATALIQKEIPNELKPLAKKPHYKGHTPEVRDELKSRGIARPKRPTPARMRRPEIAAQYDLDMVTYEDRVAEVWTALGYQHYTDTGDGFGEGWNKHIDFNPNSPDQKLAYIVAKYGEKEIPRHPKTKRPTTGEDGLERLAKRKNDRALELIIDSANANKLLTTFLENWSKGPDGRVHPEYTDNPSTFRFSSKNPNGQNFPRRSLEAKKMREMILPYSTQGEGWLIDIDFSGIEAVLVGHYANDPDYVWLAKRGVHAWYASTILAEMGLFDVIPLDLPKGDLEIALKECKRLAKSTKVPGRDMTVYDEAKPTIHGPVPLCSEVLTPAGWVTIADYQTGTPIAEWDNGAIRFEVPKALIKGHAPQLLEFDSHYYKVACTPEHGLPVIQTWTPDATVINEQAQNLTSNHRGLTTGQFEFPGTLDIDTRLAAAIQADATMAGSGVVFHLVKPRKLERLLALLGDRTYTKIPCNCHPNGWRVRLPASVVDEARWIIDERTRSFNANVLQLSHEGASALLDELLYWDGSVSKNGARQYYSTSKDSATWVQTLAHLLGTQAKLSVTTDRSAAFGSKPLYHVYFSRRQNPRIPKNPATIEHNAPVACFTTTAGRFLLRYKDTIIVSCNSNYLMQPGLMASINPDIYADRNHAARRQRIYLDAFPSITRWHHTTLWDAHYNHYIENDFGGRRWGWDVLKWWYNDRTREWEIKPDNPKCWGRQAKKIIASNPQSSLAFIMRQCMGTPEFRDLVSRGLVLLQIHDSMVARALDPDLDRVIETLYTVMTRPVPELGNLTVPVEIAIGRNWSSMTDYTVGSVHT